MKFEDLLTRSEWMNLGSISDAGDASYELFWDRYFTLMVRDEGAAAFRKEEAYAGSGVRVFTKSWLLAEHRGENFRIMMIQPGVYSALAIGVIWKAKALAR